MLIGGWSDLGQGISRVGLWQTLDFCYLLKKIMSIVEKDEINEEFVTLAETLESWRTGHEWLS